MKSRPVAAHSALRAMSFSARSVSASARRMRLVMAQRRIATSLEASTNSIARLPLNMATVTIGEWQLWTIRREKRPILMAQSGLCGDRGSWCSTAPLRQGSIGRGWLKTTGTRGSVTFLALTLQWMTKDCPRLNPLPESGRPSQELTNIHAVDRNRGCKIGPLRLYFLVAAQQTLVLTVCRHGIVDNR